MKHGIACAMAAKRHVRLEIEANADGLVASRVRVNTCLVALVRSNQLQALSRVRTEPSDCKVKRGKTINKDNTAEMEGHDPGGPAEFEASVNAG